MAGLSSNVIETLAPQELINDLELERGLAFDPLLSRIDSCFLTSIGHVVHAEATLDRLLRA